VTAVVIAAASAGGVGPAQAQAVPAPSFVENVGSGLCLTAKSEYTAGMAGCEWDANYPTDQIWSFVAGTTLGGHPYVQIESEQYPGMCLFQTGSAGPLVGSVDVELEQCYQFSSGDSQVWALSNPAAGISQFFTFGGRDCLDGEYGVFGYPENGCATGNKWQQWEVAA
jgi:hypothetical protein